MNRSLVAIVMGSESDLTVMNEAVKMLDKFNVQYEVIVASAHRSPGLVHEFSKGAEEAGFEVIIAGAGGAAHLPGVIAAETVLPVIGVPIDSSPLNGFDSLLSIVQMPAGVPVATMAVGVAGARNAALLAIQILSRKDITLLTQLKQYKSDMADAIEKKQERLMNAFWPGPLTIVFRASESVSPLLTAYTGKIGIRLPDNELCRNVIAKLEHSITATSANITGEKSLENPEDVIKAIGDKIDVLIDGGTTRGGYESSVVDVTGKQPVILREGAISGSIISYLIKAKLLRN